MPRRKQHHRDDSPTLPTRGVVTTTKYGPGIASLVCLKRELDDIYRGNSPWLCRCPLCAPMSWCTAVPAGGGVCWHPRYDSADARKYPFCARHYRQYVDCWPRPDDDTLTFYVDVAKSQALIPNDDTGHIGFNSPSDIYAACLERVQPGPDASMVATAKRQIAGMRAGGEKVGGL